MDKNIYTIINGELYHYGVPGMKWGKRKAQDIGADDYKASKIKKRLADKQFRQDVKVARKYGLEGDYELDTRTGEMRVTQWYNSKHQKIGEAYAKKVLDAASRTGRIDIRYD